MDVTHTTTDMCCLVRCSSSELWCGQAGGRISIWDLHSTQGSLRKAMHFDSGMGGGDVLSIATCHQDPTSVWSYVYPGTVVYCWDSRSLNITAQLDVSKYGVGKRSAQSPHQIGKSEQALAN